MKTFISIIIGAMLVAILITVIISAMDSSDKIDCLKWQNQSKLYTGFYLTQWQSNQCNSLGIIINAPIK